MRLVYLTLCVTTLLLCGCDKNAQTLDTNEENNPFVKQGQAYMNTKDWDQAELSFIQAINNNPAIAKPHLDLATIYHQYKFDYINAIYHYKRYLDLRPNSEKEAFINEQIYKVQIDWANAVFERTGITKNTQDLQAALQAAQQKLQQTDQYVQQLRQENNDLNARLIKLQQQTTEPQKTAEQTTPSAESPPGAEATHIVYTVVEGDTLSGIAKKHYGSSGKWDLIYEANKAHMIGPGDLRIGQTIIIPNLTK